MSFIRGLWLTVLLLNVMVAGGRAQAQVVIRERVELGASEQTSARGDELSGCEATSPSIWGDAWGDGFRAAESGTIEFTVTEREYWQYHMNFDAGGVTEVVFAVMIDNGDYYSVAVPVVRRDPDTINPYQLPLKYRYALAEGTYTLGPVEAGSLIRPVARVEYPDQTGWLDDPPPAGVWEGYHRCDTRYDELDAGRPVPSGLTYNMLVPEWEGKESPWPFYIWGSVGGRFSLDAPQIRFLRQDDELIPTEEEDADEAVLMVSKFVTDEELPGAVGFTSPYATGGPDAGLGDLHTFRPQVIGLDAGVAETISFRVEVLREGQPTEYSATFEAVEGVLENGAVAYRGRQHLRLVSNAPPPGAPGFADYDDEYAEDQTILVKLGDTVKVTALIDDGGQETEYATVELPVGRPANEDGRNAIRRAELNWITYEDVDAVPATITDRMSEDWAQAAVRYEEAGSRTFSQNDLGNVVQIRFRRRGPLRGPYSEAPEAGVFSITLELGNGTTVPVSVAYAQGDNLYAVAQRAQDAIRAAAADLTESVARVADVRDDGGLVNPLRAERFYLIVGPGSGARVVEQGGNDVIGLDDAEFGLDDSLEPLPLYDLRAIALTLKDADPQTIDVLVLRNNALGASLAGSSPYGLTADASDSEIGSTIFLVEKTADESDDWGTVAGHEVGHALLAGTGNGDHSPVLTNLMYGSAFDPEAGVLAEYENYGDPKRLTEAQQDQVRADSGPQNGGIVLLQQ